MRRTRSPTRRARAWRRSCADLGYTPDLTARGLTLQRTGLVGAVVPLLTNSLIAEIVQGLSDTVARNGFQLLVGATGFSAAGEEAMVRAFLSRRVDAIYLTGITHTAATIAMLRQSRIPCVEGGNLARNPIDMAVGYSSKDAARTVTRYLIEERYSPLGYIGAWPKDNDRARDRRRGFEAACKSAGIVVDDSMVHRDRPRPARRRARDGNAARPPSGRPRRVLLGRYAGRRRDVRSAAATTSQSRAGSPSPDSMTSTSRRKSCRR